MPTETEKPFRLSISVPNEVLAKHVFGFPESVHIAQVVAQEGRTAFKLRGDTPAVEDGELMSLNTNLCLLKQAIRNARNAATAAPGSEAHELYLQAMQELKEEEEA